MATMAQRWIGVQDALQGHIDKLAKEITALTAAGQTITPARLAEMARYQDLLMQARREIARYAQAAARTVTAEQAALAQLALTQAQQALLAQIGLTFSLLPTAAVEAMIGLTAAGSPLYDVLLATWPDAIDGLTKALIDGTALGWNPRKTARAMREGIDKALERMLTIARSEQLRVYRHATLEGYRQSGVVRGYKRICAKQERTCIACLVEDGRFYELANEFSDHVNGRCAAVPCVRNRNDPQWETGRTWFEGLDDEAQQRIMGREYWEAWRDGAFGLDDVADHTSSPIWGDSIRTKSLRELIP